MRRFAEARRRTRPQAISRYTVIEVHVYQVGNVLCRATKYANGVTGMERTLNGRKVENEEFTVKLISGNPSTFKPDPPYGYQPPQVNPETYEEEEEEDKEYYNEFGKIRFLGSYGSRGLESLIKFLDVQADLKTWKNIEIHETEFGKLQFRVENFGGATTIERILKVKNDV